MAPIELSITPPIVDLKDAYRDPIRFRYSAMDSPTIQPAKTIELLKGNYRIIKRIKNIYDEYNISKSFASSKEYLVLCGVRYLLSNRINPSFRNLPLLGQAICRLFGVQGYHQQNGFDEYEKSAAIFRTSSSIEKTWRLQFIQSNAKKYITYIKTLSA